MKPEVEPIDVYLYREEDEFWLQKWEDTEEDFVWGPVSAAKKWKDRLNRCNDRGMSIAQHLRSPDVVAPSPGVEASSTGDAAEDDSIGGDTAKLKFRAGTWRPVTTVNSPAGLVTANARVLHSNSAQGRALGFGQLMQLQKELPAILVHQIHESYVVCIVYIPND